MRTLAAAEDELVEGGLWYEQQRAGLGEQFIDEYQQAVARILASPQSFSRMEMVRTKRNIRRCLLDRFPYYVAYEIRVDEIIILAVAHAKRRPNYWLRRK